MSVDIDSDLLYINIDSSTPIDKQLRIRATSGSSTRTTTIRLVQCTDNQLTKLNMYPLEWFRVTSPNQVEIIS